MKKTYAVLKKRIKLSSYGDVDKSVLFWFEQVQKYNNVTVSGNDIQFQAFKFTTMLGHSEFKASNGWLYKFKERNGISLKTTIGEAGAGRSS
ncbi:tigger transposable element-derived 6 [Brachionus plicatilis]|uniref:Tigger transposable element-derived 6 n=1 Tax=Brachionus plicatilis TaxID=10195 RepID=A0A3M7Q4J1_BRAPC|nr:tigger transposable element-derived 6 [Brachionus plicatilis]